ncbi:hypothetical protein Vi05172_g11749 [Venturia inaequalis]|nr:hypothetical protein Vi05172_g11749 [Venturia inaequalis]
MKFVSALAIALLSVTASAALQGAAMPALPATPAKRGYNPRTACKTYSGPNHAGVCIVYSTLDYTKPTLDQVDCLTVSKYNPEVR